MVSDLISGEEKRHALERVIASRTFSRSDQLRNFLRYICEAEFEGRAQELNEYVLGVSVLGRPANYSPTEDSCVRSRAYELRGKLKSYYRLEAPDDPIQIEIRKGAYVPQFQRMMEAKPSDLPVTQVEAPELPPPVPASPAIPPATRTVFRPGIAMILVALLAVPALYYVYSAGEKSGAKTVDPQGWTPEMASFWKPFLNSATPLIVSFEVRLFFFSPSSGLVVRDYQTNQLADLAGSKPLAEFRARMGAPELQETSDYADFGAVHAAFLLGRLLGPHHREIGLKHSAALGWEDLWNSNVIFIGKPNLNPTIRYALNTPDFTDNLGEIRNLHPLPGEPAEYRSATSHGSGVKYALITLLPGPQPGRHVMILSGAGAEFLWALAESVTDPAHVKELVSRLRLPSGELPGAFQVVIEGTFESNVPIKVRYVTHRISKTS
jgi:hypothetical protein